jgi:hypothetical protein
MLHPVPDGRVFPSRNQHRLDRGKGNVMNFRKSCLVAAAVSALLPFASNTYGSRKSNFYFHFLVQW